MEKLNMNKLLSDAVAYIKREDGARLESRQALYKALLAVVHGFKYLTGTEEPTANSPGFLTFSVGPEFRLRVECNVRLYHVSVQKCPKNANASKLWEGNHEYDTLDAVCETIAKGIAEALGKQAAAGDS